MTSNAKVILIAPSKAAPWGDDGEAIKRAGYKAVLCNGALDALDELNKNGADAIVAVTELSDINGFLLSSLLKNDGRLDHLPIILIRNSSDSDRLWDKGAVADEVINHGDLDGGGDILNDLLEKSIARAAQLGWNAAQAKGLYPTGKKLSTKDSAVGVESILNDLLIERVAARIAHDLSEATDSRKQFVETYFQKVVPFVEADVLGMAVTNTPNPWLAIDVRDGLADTAFDALVKDVNSKLTSEGEIAIERRGEFAEKDGEQLKASEVLPIKTSRETLGGLVFGSYSKEFDQATKLFLSELQNAIHPVVQLLIAKQEIEALRTREVYRANIDSLTGLYNLEFLVGFLQQQLLFSFRQRLPVGVAIIDIDSLESINEVYGTEIGDTVLTAVANRLLAITRSSDLIARYGGDEFAVVLPNTDGAGAKVLGEKVRSDIEQFSFGRGGGKGPKVTVSVGCANFNMEDLNPETILRDAKLALRRAKDEGPNKVAM